MKKTLILLLITTFLAIIPFSLADVYVYQEDADEYAFENYYFYSNYTNITNTDIFVWQVKHSVLSIYNITILDNHSCFTPVDDKMLLRMYSNPSVGAGVPKSEPQCYNGTGWMLIGTHSETGGTCTAYGGSINTDNLHDDNYNTYSAFLDGDNTWRYDDAGFSNDCYYGVIYEEGAFMRKKYVVNEFRMTSISGIVNSSNYSGNTSSSQPSIGYVSGVSKQVYLGSKDYVFGVLAQNVGYPSGFSYSGVSSGVVGRVFNVSAYSSCVTGSCVNVTANISLPGGCLFDSGYVSENSLGDVVSGNQIDTFWMIYCDGVGNHSFLMSFFNAYGVADGIAYVFVDSLFVPGVGAVNVSVPLKTRRADDFDEKFMDFVRTKVKGFFGEYLSFIIFGIAVIVVLLFVIINRRRKKKKDSSQRVVSKKVEKLVFENETKGESK